ncbi:MAG: hypothetical protein AAF985_21290, partial [Bacteroidota bacterium]
MTATRYSSLWLVLLLFAQCTAPRYSHPNQYADEKITFGNGGGYSGLITEYTLLKNGQLFKKTTIDTAFQELPNLEASAVRQIFNNYHFLKLGKVFRNDPANR